MSARSERPVMKTQMVMDVMKAVREMMSSPSLRRVHEWVVAAALSALEPMAFDDMLQGLFAVVASRSMGWLGMRRGDATLVST